MRKQANRSRCGGEGWLGAVGWTLLSHHGQGLSFLPFYRDIFSYSTAWGSDTEKGRQSSKALLPRQPRWRAVELNFIGQMRVIADIHYRGFPSKGEGAGYLYTCPHQWS